MPRFLASDCSPVRRSLEGLPCRLVASFHKRECDPDVKMPVARGMSPQSGCFPAYLSSLGVHSSPLSAPTPLFPVLLATLTSWVPWLCSALVTSGPHRDSPPGFEFSHLWASPRSPCWPLRAQVGSPFQDITCSCFPVLGGSLTPPASRSLSAPLTLPCGCGSREGAP